MKNLEGKKMDLVGLEPTGAGTTGHTGINV